VQVAGRPLIDHALDLLRRAGIGRVVANTHHLPEMLESHLVGTGVQVVREQVLLETGGGLRNALPLLGNGPVITLNSDAVWQGGDPVSTLLDAWDGDAMDALLMLVAPEHAHGHTGSGDFTLGADGRLSRGPGHVYTGLQVIRTDGLADIAGDIFSLNLLWDRMAAKGRLFGMVHPGGWCDVGRPESIAPAEAMLDV
jgi:MurNAc alpha-1-phosphate uridylyltransferase